MNLFINGQIGYCFGHNFCTANMTLPKWPWNYAMKPKLLSFRKKKWLIINFRALTDGIITDAFVKKQFDFNASKLEI